MFDQLARVGVMGFVALCVVLTTCSLAAYAVVQGVDGETTTALVTTVTVGAGAVLGASGKFFGGDNQ